MNKFILVFMLILVGCATAQPTRTAVNCQAEPIIDSKSLFIGGSKVKDEIECKMVQVPLAPKAQPLAVDPKLIDKNQN